MRIALQHATSGLYVKEPGAWTSDLKEALDFGSSKRAIRFMRQQRLHGVQVLVSWADVPLAESLTSQATESEGPKPAGHGGFTYCG